MKDWWLNNWRTLLGSTAVAALIAGVFSIVVALINKRKKDDKETKYVYSNRASFKQH